jgi:hypothetical protein
MSNFLFRGALLTFLTVLGGATLLPAPAHARPKAGHGHKPAPAPKPAHHKRAPAPKPAHHKPAHHKPAHGHKPVHHHKPIVGTHAAAMYAQTHGVKLKSGHYAYKGLKHRQWTKRYYSPTWSRWFWYDPGTAGWYYWSGATDYYLPVRFLSVVAPSGSELPPGATQVPLAAASEIPNLPEPR